jgi:hypothetical protein
MRVSRQAYREEVYVGEFSSRRPCCDEFLRQTSIFASQQILWNCNTALGRWDRLYLLWSNVIVAPSILCIVSQCHTPKLNITNF